MSWLERALILAPHFRLITSKPDYLREAKRLHPKADHFPPWVVDGAGATTNVFHPPNKAPVALVCLKSWRGRTTAEVHSLLAHEAVHVWQVARDDMGEDSPGDEVEAYAIHRISLQLMTAFERFRRGSRGRARRKK